MSSTASFSIVALAFATLACGCAGAAPSPRDPSQAAAPGAPAPPPSSAGTPASDGTTATNAPDDYVPEPTPPGCKPLPNVSDTAAPAGDYAAQMAAARALVNGASAVDPGEPPSSDQDRATWVKSCLGTWFRWRTHTMQVADGHFADAARATRSSAEQAAAAAEAAEAWTVTLEALVTNGERGEPAAWKSDAELHARFREVLRQQTDAWAKQQGEPPYAECMHLTATPDLATLRAKCAALGQRLRALR